MIIPLENKYSGDTIVAVLLSLLPNFYWDRFNYITQRYELHMEDKIGSLEPGKKADVIVVEPHSMNMMPNYNPYATLVYQANPSNVEYTIVNGKIVMVNRKLTNIDEDEIRTKTIAIENDIRIFAQELAKKAIKSKSIMD